MCKLGDVPERKLLLPYGPSACPAVEPDVGARGPVSHELLLSSSEIQTLFHNWLYFGNAEAGTVLLSLLLLLLLAVCVAAGSYSRLVAEVLPVALGWLQLHATHA